MRIARVQVDGVKYVASNGDGNWHDLGQLGVHLTDSASVVNQLDTIRSVVADAGPDSAVSPGKFLSPIVRPTHSLAVGRNYVAHAEETGSEVPTRPVIFSKLPASYIGTGDTIAVDRDYTEELDYEVELVVLIGREATMVSADDALKYVAGYLVGNDVSARDRQRGDGQYDLAKGMNTFGPNGPWITTADEVPDPQALDLGTTVDGEERQSSNTKSMIFSVSFLIEYLSRVITLQPGDVIWTGTPHGVALGRENKPFLQTGQTVECTIDGLGTVSNPVAYR